MKPHDASAPVAMAQALAAALLESLAVLWIRRARGGAGRHFTFQPVPDRQPRA